MYILNVTSSIVLHCNDLLILATLVETNSKQFFPFTFSTIQSAVCQIKEVWRSEIYCFLSFFFFRRYFQNSFHYNKGNYISLFFVREENKFNNAINKCYILLRLCFLFLYTNSSISTIQIYPFIPLSAIIQYSLRLLWLE